MSDLAQHFNETFGELAAIGRDSTTGGLNRAAWSPAELAAREWFTERAEGLGLELETDRNGNVWAWWGEPGPGTVATGSHLDSVPDGGSYDGGLGVVSSLLALEQLKNAGISPKRPVAIVAFTEEEGSRFGVPTLGSRLLTGALQPPDVLERSDSAGLTLADTLRGAGIEPDSIGADPDRLSLLTVFIELHVEQGRRLALEDSPLGLASEIWPHGRWHIRVEGQPDHAGTARLQDREDPMLVLATAISAAREAATAFNGVATIGKVNVYPNGPNIVPGRVDAWLDARAPDEEQLDNIVEAWMTRVDESAKGASVKLEVQNQSFSPRVEFDSDLRARLKSTLKRIGLDPPTIPTAAGHDAGILADELPAGMLFVRNPTGISHSPLESATVEDCVLGVRGLAAVLEDLATQG